MGERRGEPDWSELAPPADRPPETRRALLQGFALGCGISLVGAVGLAIAAAAGLGFLMESKAVPDVAAVPGADLSEDVLRMLRGEGLLEPQEPVFYYYSDALLDYREDGQFFTDRRIVSYWTEGDDLLWEEAAYPDVAAIRPAFADGFMELSEVWVEREDGSTFLVLVSNDSGGDHAFVDLLRATWQERR